MYVWIESKSCIDASVQHDLLLWFVFPLQSDRPTLPHTACATAIPSIDWLTRRVDEIAARLFSISFSTRFRTALGAKINSNKSHAAHVDRSVLFVSILCFCARELTVSFINTKQSHTKRGPFVTSFLMPFVCLRFWCLRRIAPLSNRRKSQKEQWTNGPYQSKRWPWKQIQKRNAIRLRFARNATQKKRKI